MEHDGVARRLVALSPEGESLKRAAHPLERGVADAAEANPWAPTRLIGVSKYFPNRGTIPANLMPCLIGTTLAQSSVVGKTWGKGIHVNRDVD